MIFIGHDPREQVAYDVAVSSLKRHSPSANPIPLNAERLAAVGLLRRPTDTRGGIYDLHSNAQCATEFAISRFIVPIICQTGWALFTDLDVVFMTDIAELFSLADPSKAVMVVKHHNGHKEGTKMDGQAQVIYPRKNWSSVCLFNCTHPANHRLSLQDVNERPGRDLHGFYWLNDAEIGELPARFNWLVNVNPKPDEPAIVHYTLGGPWLPNWKTAEHDEIWLEASR